MDAIGYPLFDGATYDPLLDERRMETQLVRVAALMADARWRTLAEIVASTGGSEAGVSARLRDLRKHRFGARSVERRRRADPSAGVWEYRVTHRH